MDKKIIDFVRKSHPENPPFGYGDSVAIIDNGEQVFIGACSTNPNAWQIETKKPWEECFAQIQPGEYRGEVMEHEKYGKCILINNGNFLPTTTPNHNHNGLYMASEIFIHRGFSDTCRGSKACFTIAHDKSDDFFAWFKIGEIVKINLRGAA